MDGLGAVLQGALLEVVKYAVAVLLPAIGLLIGKLLIHFTTNIDNDRVRALAIQAVLWAEDKFGSKEGDKKLDAAIQFVMDKTKLSYAEAEKIVRAAYQNVFAPFKETATG